MSACDDAMDPMADGRTCEWLLFITSRAAISLRVFEGAVEGGIHFVTQHFCWMRVNRRGLRRV